VITNIIYYTQRIKLNIKKVSFLIVLSVSYPTMLKRLFFFYSVYANDINFYVPKTIC